MITNIDTVISQVKKYQSSIDGKQRLLMKRLSDIGVEVSVSAFTAVPYDGEKDFKVGTHWEDNKLVIEATGDTVLFLEFGTGVFQPPYPIATDYVRGEYGQGKGKNESWTYYGTKGGIKIAERGNKTVYRTFGNPPARAMYDASKAMRERISEIAKGVFGG